MADIIKTINLDFGDSEEELNRIKNSLSGLNQIDLNQIQTSIDAIKDNLQNITFENLQNIPAIPVDIIPNFGDIQDIPPINVDIIPNFGELNIPEIPSQDLEIVPNVGDITIPEIDDVSVDIVPNIEEIVVPKPEDITYEVTPIVEQPDIPEVPDQSYEVTPIVEIPEIPEVADQEYNVIPNIEDISVPEAPDQEYNVIPNVETPNIEEIPNQEYDITPIVEEPIISDISDITYEVTPIVEEPIIPQPEDVSVNIVPDIQEINIPQPEDIEVDVTANVQDIKTPNLPPIKLDVTADKTKIDELINSLKKGQKLPVEFTPDDKKIKTSVDSIKKSIQGISDEEVNIDVKSNISDVSDDVDDLRTDLQKKIEIAIDTQKSATSIREFTRSQKELQGLLLQIGDEGSKDFEKVAIAIGTGNERMDELQDKIKSLSNEPIQNLSNGFKGVRDSILSLNFEEFNDRVKNLSVISKQVSFKDLSGSIVETGKSFATLGKLIATNPLGLLITGISLLISNFDKIKDALGPLLVQFELVGDVIGFITDAFFALTDAIGLTAKAEQEAADKSIAANEKRKKSVKENLAAQESYYSATKDLTDEEIKSIEERTGVIIENEEQILDIRIKTAQETISANKSSLSELQSLEAAKGKLSDDEIKQKEELVKEIEEANRDIVRSEAEKVLQQKKILEDSGKEAQNLQIQSIQDSNKRAQAQIEFDKSQRETTISEGLSSAQKALQEAESTFKQKQIDIENFKIGGVLTGDFKTQKEAELKELEVTLNNAKSVVDNFNAQKTSSDVIAQNAAKELAKQQREEAKNNAERAAQDQLKVITDTQQVLINKTVENTAERLQAEITSSKKIEEFVKTRGKALGFSETEITLKIQEETKKREELEKNYNSEIIRLNNEKNISRINLEVLNASTLEERLKANTSLIEENARQEIQELRQTVTDKELLAVREEEITTKKNKDIRKSNLELQTEERNSIIETNLLRVENDIKEAEKLPQVTAQRIQNIKTVYTAEVEALNEKEKLELAAVEDNEAKKEEIREKYRGERLDAEKKLADDIQKEREKEAQQLQEGLEGINILLQSTNGAVGEVGQSINNLIGGIANGIPDLFKVLNDENAESAEKIGAYLALAQSAVQGIGQVLSSISNQRLDEINQEETAATTAAENEYTSQLNYINANITDEEKRKTAIAELDKKTAKSNEDLRKKYAKIELEEKRKAFNQQKAISIVQAVIGTAQGVVQALTAGPIVGPILAGVVGALGAVQIGLIKSQKFPEGGSAGGGGGGGSISSPGGGAPSSPTPFEAPQFFGIGGQQQGTTPPPTPVIIENNILETDITRTQRTVGIIETRASIV